MKKGGVGQKIYRVLMAAALGMSGPLSAWGRVCNFHLQTLHNYHLAKHPPLTEAQKAEPAFGLLQEQLKNDAAFVSEKLGTVKSVSELGGGRYGTVYRLLGENGESMLVKVFGIENLRNVRREKTKLQVLKAILGPTGQINEPLAPESPRAFYSSDNLGVNLMAYLQNSKIPQEWKQKAQIRYVEIMQRLDREAVAWAKANGYEYVKPKEAVPGEFSLRKGSEKLDFWVHEENAIVKPDGSLVIIDAH